MAKFGYYMIHMNKHDEDPLYTMEVFKESFSIIAAVLTFIWFLMKRMWIWGIGLFAFLLAMTYVQFIGYIDLETTYIIRGVLFVLLGTSAYDLYGMALKKRGYTLEAVIIARDEMEAKLKFLKSHNDSTTEAKTEPVVNQPLPSSVTGSKPPELKW